MTYAKIIADSISPEGVRLTTQEVRVHRFVLAEFNTHRVFSRNSASSRAIPFGKQVERVMDNIAYPLSFPKEQRGMQGGDELDEDDVEKAKAVWSIARRGVVQEARLMHDLGVHKSVVNRMLEPFMWHTIVVTSTSWENFFHQRCHPAAQPEIRVAAEMMREAMNASEPQKLVEGEWHLPYIESEDWAALFAHAGPAALGKSMYPEMVKVSAARCARVSYLTQAGKRDIAEDLDLYQKLVTRESDEDPRHWSPLEHVATPWAANRQRVSRHVLEMESACTPLDFVGLDGRQRWLLPTDHLPRVGNLLGWRSLRTTVEAEMGAVTFR